MSLVEGIGAEVVELEIGRIDVELPRGFMREAASEDEREEVLLAVIREFLSSSPSPSPSSSFSFFRLLLRIARELSDLTLGIGGGSYGVMEEDDDERD